jgi:acetate kinase
LIGIRAAQHALPNTPQVGCFDTAFHTTIPRVAYLYALPYRFYEQHGVRRYGFHGSSHRYVAGRAAELLGLGRDAVNCITCHLGNGCSMTAVRRGKSVDTSMGLTPLEGLVMGTRSGDFDPAILFFLADKGYDLATLNTICNKQSGLVGLSGSSNDMRVLSEKAAAGDERAQLAIDVFCYRVKKYIGAYAAVLGRIDAVVFTGGIGENAVDVRAKCCHDLAQLGIEIDLERNAAVRGREGEIQSVGSQVKLLVIPTDEEGVIAADTYELTAGKAVR